MFEETLALDSDICMLVDCSYFQMGLFLCQPSDRPPICHGCIFFVSCICFLLEVTTLLLVYFWYVCVWVFFFCLCELVITAVWVSHLLKCVWDGHAIAAWDLLQIFLCDVPSVLRVTQLQRCQHGTELDNLFSSKCSTLIYKCIHSAHTYSKHTYPHTQTLN